MSGLISLVKELVIESGCASHHIHVERNLELPGYFRPAKRWDLIVIVNRRLLAAIEFKSQIGSLGNNINNRAEEAIGNGVDLWKAYEHGLLHSGLPRPWLGYFFLLEDCQEARSVVRVRTPHFKVDPAFADATYQHRYERLCERLVQDDIYQKACFLMSGREKGPGGHYLEPNEQLTFERFVTALCAHVNANS